MNRNAFAKLTCIFLALSLGCIKEDVVDVGPISFVSLTHTSPDAPDLDILVDDQQINNVPFEYGLNTGYIRFTSGVRNIKFRPYGGGTVAIDTTISLETDESFSLFVVDEFAKAKLVMLYDDPEPPTSAHARLRFINLSPDSEPLQLKIKDVATPLTVAQSFTTYSSFMDVEAKSYNFEIVSSSATVTELSNIPLQSGFFYTIFVLGYVTPPTDNTNSVKALVIIH